MFGAAIPLLAVGFSVGPGHAVSAADARLVAFSAPATGLDRGAGYPPDSINSHNWAGYAGENGEDGYATSVGASWTQPAIACSGTGSQTAADFFVGLDGAQLNSPTLEAIGTTAECANGSVTYAAWYSTLPASPINFANTVQPGDAMSAAVIYNGDGNFTLSLSDTTQGWAQTTVQSAPDAQRVSAEVLVAERTGFSLADFGAVSFSDVTVNYAPIADSANLIVYTMEQSISGPVEAAPTTVIGGSAYAVVVPGTPEATSAGTQICLTQTDLTPLPVEGSYVTIHGTNQNGSPASYDLVVPPYGYASCTTDSWWIGFAYVQSQVYPYNVVDQCTAPVAYFSDQYNCSLSGS